MSCKQFALKVQLTKVEKRSRAFEGCLPYKVVGNREWNCGAYFAEEGMPFSQSAISS